MKSALPVEELLLVCGAMLLVVRIAHALARRARQPAVVAELAVGILLGLAIPAGLEGELLSGPVREGLAALGGFGLLLFLFETGSGAAHGPSSRQGRSVLLVGGAAFLVPFVAGVPVAAAIAGDHGPGAGKTAAFVLFLATALAVTALPVLARIVTDLGLAKTRLGSLSVGSAAVCDGLAWTMLAVALAVGSARDLWSGVGGPIGALAFVAFLLTVVRRGVLRIAARGPVARYPAAALLCAGVLLSSYVTSWLGVHAIFGAFIFGFAVRPAGDVDPLEPARAVLRPLAALLVPIYFILSGMAVDLGAVAAEIWLLGALGAVAVAGKFAAAAGAGALLGMNRRDIALTGVLMNTRGITELVVLSVGYSAGLLDQAVFGAMTIFALLATAVTGPVLNRWGPKGTRAAPVLAEAARRPEAVGVGMKSTAHTSTAGTEGEEDGAGTTGPGGTGHGGIDEHRGRDGGGVRP